MSLTPEQRKLRARMAALSMHAAGKTNTSPARTAWDQRFYDEVDPDHTLPAEERERRAQYARSAYMTGLALKSSIARARKGR